MTEIGESERGEGSENTPKGAASLDTAPLRLDVETRRPRGADPCGGLFLQMPGEVLVHLEHADRGLAAEHRLELGVSQDLALVGGILQVVLLDVGPDLRDHLASRDLAPTNDGCQF